MNFIFRHLMILIIGLFFLGFFVVQSFYPTASCSMVFSFANVALGLKYDRVFAGGDAAEKDELLYYLQRQNDYVIDHESAHSKAFGKWAGGVKYYYYAAEGRNYAVAGCATHKLGIPLEVKYKAFLAPMEPSQPDKISAKFFLAFLHAGELRFSKASEALWDALSETFVFVGPTLLVVISLALSVFALFRMFT